jgi:hypothetical protein
MPRFAILHHDHPTPHYDLLIQVGAAAWTWRLPSPPGPEPVPAERIAEHRLYYLDYEGEVSGGRGRVARIDGGEYAILHLGPDRLEVVLEGSTYRGVLRIEGGAAVFQAGGP